MLSSPNVLITDPETGELVKFEEDAKTSLGCYALGRNKIFLRHPQALSTLEILREKKIPEIVNILENSWRRYKNRIVLAKFIAAEKELSAAYKAITANCLERRKRRAGANDKDKIAVLYATWNAVWSKLLKPDNRLSNQLALDEKTNMVVFMQSNVRAASHRRYYVRLQKAQMVVSKRFRGGKARKQLTCEMWQACKTALLGVRTEFERFLGKKKRRRDSLDRVFKGDYINVKQYPAYESILNQRGPQKLLFAAMVNKVNERFVHQQRVLLVGEKTIYNCKADKIHQPKERRAIDMARVSGIIMSTLPDNYVVLQVKTEFDILMAVEQKTELVTVLRKRFKDAYGRDLPVKFADEFEYNALKGRPQLIKFEYDRNLKETETRKLDKRTMVIAVGRN